MWWLFLSKKKRLERKKMILTAKLNNFDRVNKGFRSEINEVSAGIDKVKDENIQKNKRLALFKRRKEQIRLEKERFKLTRELNKVITELNKIK